MYSTVSMFLLAFAIVTAGFFSGNDIVIALGFVAAVIAIATKLIVSAIEGVDPNADDEATNKSEESTMPAHDARH